MSSTRPIEILHPRAVEEALSMAARAEARFVAGGTALQLEWTQGIPRPDLLVNLGRIPALHGVTVTDGHIRVGALTSLATLQRDRAIRDQLPLLLAAIGATAGPAVRNLATLGGNVAGRKGCLLPALLALDARVAVATPDGSALLPLAQWLLDPPVTPSVVEALEIPRAGESARWTHRKIGLRASFTPSVIGVAGTMEMTGDRVSACRLVVGGGVVRPVRLRDAEALITGLPLAAIDWSAVHRRLMLEISAPDDAFRSGEYRRRVAANALVHGLGGHLPARPRARPAGPIAAAPLAGDLRLAKVEAKERWHVRPDGAAKIEGRLEYLTDRRGAGMLVGRILRAGIPHARILRIDTRAAEALPGVVAVVTHRDVAGSNAFGIVVQDQPALCHDKVRYAGDAVAAVAAVDAETAARALERIEVLYEPLPLVDDPERALDRDAEPVHASGNLQRELKFERGDVAQGFARAVHVVEATYVTPRQMHGFMETEGGHAFVDEDGILNVCAGGQHGGRDRLQLARILGMAEEQIRVVTSPTGGAFGGKDELTVQPALALLALKTGRPVRLQLDRAESVVAGIKSNPMRIRMRTACDAEGRLVAQEVELLADAGAYASLGPGVVETALEHACGPYEVANIRTLGRLAYTNNGVCGAFRGFGSNQMTYAIECQMDRLAAACGLDPFEIRSRNMRRPGAPGYFGQVVAPTERLAAMLQAARADPIWGKPRGLSDDGSQILGIGMAMNFQGTGLGTIPPDPSGGMLRLAADGVIEALYGLDELGQGLLTAIRSAVATQLGCAREDVRPVTGDTGRTPESGSTTASRGAYVVWRVAADAAPLLTEQLLAAAASLLGRPLESLAIAPGGIIERGSNSRDLRIGFAELARALAPEDLPQAVVQFEFPKSDYFEGNARLIFAFGATLARVAVDRITGQVRVLDLSQHTAAGPVLDVAAYLGQIEGGSLQGLGFTTTEDAVMRGGAHIAANLDQYMLPGIVDAPETMAVYALEDLEPDDRFGPRGVGELGIGAVAPAIANAVAEAAGFWPERAPFCPQAILDRLAEVR